MWVFLGRDTHDARPDALAGGSECLTVKNFTGRNATNCVNQHRQVTETAIKPGLKCKEQIYSMTSLTGGSWSNTRAETQEWEHHLWFPLCALWPLSFHLSPKTGSSGVSMRVPPSPSKRWCCLYTEILLLNTDRGQTAVGVKVWGFPHLYFSSLGVPSCEVTWGNLPPPHQSSSFNPFLPTPIYVVLEFKTVTYANCT